MKNVKRILLSMILVVVIQLCFPCDTISATELSASGRITGLQNGDAANVILYNNYQSYSAATDEKGNYSFRGIEWVIILSKLIWQDILYQNLYR